MIAHGVWLGGSPDITAIVHGIGVGLCFFGVICLTVAAILTLSLGLIWVLDHTVERDDG